MMSKPFAYLNGQFLPASQAVLSPNDIGFLWGATVTDRLRTFRHRLFRLEDHLQRFQQSCEMAFVPQPRSLEDLAQIASELIAANAELIGPDEELSLIIFATPGTEPGLPTLGMQTAPLPLARYRQLRQEGALLVPVACTIAGEIIDPRIKHRSRLAWWIAAKQVAPPAEPLFTTPEPQRFVRETPIANIVVEIDGRLVSPPRSQILNGISLQVVEELCRALGIPFVEREIALDDLLSCAGECLLSNTSFCLAPISRIGDCPKRMNGPFFQRLAEAWGCLVGQSI